MDRASAGGALVAHRTSFSEERSREWKHRRHELRRSKSRSSAKCESRHLAGARTVLAESPRQPRADDGRRGDRMSNWTLQIGLQGRKRLIPWERATCGCRCKSPRWECDRQYAECVAHARRELDPRTSDLFQRLHFLNLLFLSK
jgi:predicted transposase YbfD/YdcC